MLMADNSVYRSLVKEIKRCEDVEAMRRACSYFLKRNSPEQTITEETLNSISSASKKKLRTLLLAYAPEAINMDFVSSIVSGVVKSEDSSLPQGTAAGMLALLRNRSPDSPAFPSMGEPQLECTSM